MSNGKNRVRAYKQSLLDNMSNGANPDCAICKKPIRFKSDLTIDHITPKFWGGKNELNNLQPAHSWCNQYKGNTRDIYVSERSIDNDN